MLAVTRTENVVRLCGRVSQKGVAVQKDSRSFETFFKTWLAQHGAAHWGKMTLEQNYKRAAYAIRMFGTVPLQKLTTMRLEQSFATLLANGGTKTATHPEGRPLSPKTVNAVAPWLLRRSTRRSSGS